MKFLPVYYVLMFEICIQIFHNLNFVNNNIGDSRGIGNDDNMKKNFLFYVVYM